jgi:V/A-type H+-transporting ATPase subunit D
MTAYPTTRMGLHQTRSALRAATSGARLLRSKRAVLADELFRVVREVLDDRTRADEELLEAQRALRVAEALEGEPALESLALAAARAVPVTVSERRVWGVPTPAIEAPRLERAADARGASPLSWGLSSTEAALRHERALEALLAGASREQRLRRLADEVRETSRRINALEQLVIPRLDCEAGRIELALDERAREELTRITRGPTR